MRFSPKMTSGMCYPLGNMVLPHWSEKGMLVEIQLSGTISYPVWSEIVEYFIFSMYSLGLNVLS